MKQIRFGSPSSHFTNNPAANDKQFYWPNSMNSHLSPGHSHPFSFLSPLSVSLILWQHLHWLTSPQVKHRDRQINLLEMNLPAVLFKISFGVSMMRYALSPAGCSPEKMSKWTGVPFLKCWVEDWVTKVRKILCIKWDNTTICAEKNVRYLCYNLQIVQIKENDCWILKFIEENI